MCWALHHVDGNLQPGGLRAEVDPLRLLYSLPTVVVVAYWRRVLAGPRGKLWFGAHSRAAEEMRSVAHALQCALRSVDRPTPHLDRLLATGSKRP